MAALTARAGPMKTLLIAYASFTGGTLQMAEAAAAGARGEEGIDVRLLQAPQATPDDLLAADGFVFATPEMLGSMAGLMKDLFDRGYYPLLERLQGRPYVALVCAGSDGQGAARQIERIATGWRLKAVAPPFIACVHAQTAEAIQAPKRLAPADLAACRELGAALAAGLALGVY
jgi:multimeric flavodoxin WrbA